MGGGINGVGLGRSHTISISNVENNQTNEVEEINHGNSAKVSKDDTEIKRDINSKLLKEDSPLVRPAQNFAESHKVSLPNGNLRPNDIADPFDLDSQDTGVHDIYASLADQVVEEPNFDDWTVANKDEIALKFDDVDAMTHGKYNLGQLKLDANYNLTCINNHQFRVLRNFSSTTPAENRNVRKAVADALRQKFGEIATSPQGRKILAAITGEEVLGQPLDRKTVGAAIDDLTKMSLYQKFSQHVGNAEVRKLIESVADDNWATQAPNRQSFIEGIASKIEGLTKRLVLPHEKLSQLVQLANIPRLKGEFVCLTGTNVVTTNARPTPWQNMEIRHAVATWLTEMRKQAVNFDVQEEFYGLPSDPLLRAVRTILLDPSNIEKELRLDDVCDFIEKLQPTVSGDERVSNEDLAFAKRVLAGESKLPVWISKICGDVNQKSDGNLGKTFKFSRSLADWFDTIGMDESADAKFVKTIEDLVSKNGGAAALNRRSKEILKTLDDFVAKNFPQSVEKHKAYMGMDGIASKMCNAIRMALIGAEVFQPRVPLADRPKIMREIAAKGKESLSYRKYVKNPIPEEDASITLARWRKRQRIGEELLARAGMNNAPQPIERQEAKLEQWKNGVMRLDEVIKSKEESLVQVQDSLNRKEANLRPLPKRKKVDPNMNRIEDGEKVLLRGQLEEEDKALSDLEDLIDRAGDDDEDEFDFRRELDNLSKKHKFIHEHLDSIMSSVVGSSIPFRSEMKSTLEIIFGEFRSLHSARMTDLAKLSGEYDPQQLIRREVDRLRQDVERRQKEIADLKIELRRTQIRIESLEERRDASPVNDYLAQLAQKEWVVIGQSEVNDLQKVMRSDDKSLTDLANLERSITTLQGDVDFIDNLLEGKTELGKYTGSNPLIFQKHLPIDKDAFTELRGLLVSKIDEFATQVEAVKQKINESGWEIKNL